MPTITKIPNTNFYHGRLTDNRKFVIYPVGSTVHIMVQSEEKMEPLTFHNSGKTLKVYFLT